MNRAAGAVIKKLSGVSYDPSQVGRLLKKVGWTRQKPQAKVRQQNPERAITASAFRFEPL